MLRTQENPDGEVRRSTDPRLEFPGVDEAFTLEERSVGILFYLGRECFFLPYHGLRSMTCTPDRLSLEFPEETVVITGRGLHTLCVGLARQQVGRVVQQGDHPGTQPTHVVRIRRIPRPVRGHGAPERSAEASGDGRD